MIYRNYSSYVFAVLTHASLHTYIYNIFVHIYIYAYTKLVISLAHQRLDKWYTISYYYPWIRGKTSIIDSVASVFMGFCFILLWRVIESELSVLRKSVGNEKWDENSLCIPIGVKKMQNRKLMLSSSDVLLPFKHLSNLLWNSRFDFYDFQYQYFFLNCECARNSFYISGLESKIYINHKKSLYFFQNVLQ